jgi:hypothetical protein
MNQNKKMQAKRPYVLAALFGAVFVVGACSDDDDDSNNGTAGKAPVAGSAGKSGGSDSGGTAGTGGKGGAGGKGGTGGGAEAGLGGGGASNCEDAIDGCPHVDACGPYPLSQICDSRPLACPSLDELDTDAVCTHATVTSRELSCGGKLIVANYGLGADTWGFDSKGVLKYKRVDSDAYGTCDDQRGASASTEWGELPCKAAGATTTLCSNGGEGGAGGAAGAGGAGGAGGNP